MLLLQFFSCLLALAGFALMIIGIFRMSMGRTVKYRFKYRPSVTYFLCFLGQACGTPFSILVSHSVFWTIFDVVFAFIFYRIYLTLREDGI